MKKNNDLGNFNNASESLKKRMLELDMRDNNGRIISWTWLIKHGSEEEIREIRQILGCND